MLGGHSTSGSGANKFVQDCVECAQEAKTCQEFTRLQQLVAVAS